MPAAWEAMSGPCAVEVKRQNSGRESGHFRHGSAGTFLLLLGIGDSTLDRTVLGKSFPAELHPQPFRSYFIAARSFQYLVAWLWRRLRQG